jgi:hypothetical protein
VSDWLEQLRALREAEAAQPASKGATVQQPAPKVPPGAGLQRPVHQQLQEPQPKHSEHVSGHPKQQQRQQQRFDRGWQGAKGPVAGSRESDHPPHPAAGKPGGTRAAPGSAKWKAPKQVAATEKQPLRSRAEGGRKRRK